MSTSFIQEPSSQRSDHKIWVWRYADPVYVPVRVNLFKVNDDGDTYADVPVGYVAKFFVKADLRDGNAIIEKVFEFTSPSVFVVDIPTEEVILLRAGRCYHVGVALYDDLGNFVRTLIADLPLRIEKSALYDSVF